MMRLFLLFVVVSALTLATTASALAHNPNENGFVGCGQHVDNQIEMGIEAGGGAKEGILAPTNCDHFFFLTGVIGNENSGGP